MWKLNGSRVLKGPISVCFEDVSWFNPVKGTHRTNRNHARPGKKNETDLGCGMD